MLLNCAQELIELVLVIFSHILEIVLKRAGVIGHPLDLELHLRVIRNSLLIIDHFLVHLVPELPELLSQLLSLILGLLEGRLKLDTR